MTHSILDKVGAAGRILIDSVMPLRVEVLADDAAPSTGPAPLLRFRAVGAVADAKYQSGRVIPAAQQQQAVSRASISGRQMTTFVGHPSIRDVDENELCVGKLEDVAGIVKRFHFDPVTKQTVLDEVHVTDTPKGRVARDLIRSGVKIGISQRAIGEQAMREWTDAGGEKHQVMLVTELFEIFGWDMVHLPDANAGDVTDIVPMADSAMRAMSDSATAAAAAVPAAAEDGPLTDAELDEFAPLFTDQAPAASSAGSGEVISDKAVPVHNPDKADVGTAWHPVQAEVNKLPNSAFAWVDEAFLKGETQDKARGRKLPHHLPNGKTVWRGVRAALAVLNGARGGLRIPQADREGVYKHLSAHYKQFGHEPPVLKDMADLPGTARDRIISAAEGCDSASRSEVEVKTKDKTAGGGQLPLPDNTQTLIAANAALADSVRTMLKAMEARLDGPPAALKDSVQGQIDAENAAEESFQARMKYADEVRQAVRAVMHELEEILSSEGVQDAEKNAKLMKMGEEVKSLFSKMTDDFVSAHKTEPGEPTAATDDSGGAAAAAAAAAGVTQAEAGATQGATTSTPEAAQPSQDSVAAASTTADSAAPAGQTGSNTTPGTPAPAVDSAAAAGTQAQPLTYVPPGGQVAAPAPEGAAPAAAPAEDKAVKATAALTDAIKGMVTATKKAGEDKKRLADNVDYATKAVARQGLESKLAASLLDGVMKQVRVDSTPEQLECHIKDSVGLLNLGRAEEQLKAMGFANKGEGAAMNMRITDVSEVHSLGAPHLAGVKLLADSFTGTGNFKMRHPEKKTIPAELAKLMARFDSHFAAELRREQEKLDSVIKTLGPGKTLLDASTGTDLEYPHTISRIILFEVYAADIIRQITDFGVMDNFRDQVPITRWRQESGASLLPTFRPSVFQRSSVKVPELGAIPRGKLVTEFFAIDAVPRKMAATLSDEFLTRAKRRPDISGAAMAANNLIEDVRRNIMQDVFFEWIRASLFHGSSAFDVLKTGDAVATTFQIIGTTPVNAVSIVPNDPRSPLIVEVGTTSANRTAVPEYGTTTVGGGPGNTFFYVPNYSLSTISFVDATGAALAPAASANNVRVRGYQADAEIRFNMNLPGGVTQDQHMLNLLFQVQNQRAKLSSGGISNVGYYDADTVLASVVNSEYMKQASAYAALFRREGFAADKVITEGNYGVTAGLGHWGSKVFPDEFLCIGDSKGVLFRQYEPLNLRGPIEGRDVTGQLNGSKEWYSYQEDSIATPLPQKFAAVTLYRA